MKMYLANCNKKTKEITIFFLDKGKIITSYKLTNQRPKDKKHKQV